MRFATRLRIRSSGLKFAEAGSGRKNQASAKMNTPNKNLFLVNFFLALGRKFLPERFKSSGGRVLDCFHHWMAKSRISHGVIRESPQSAAQTPCVNPTNSSLKLETSATKLHGSQKTNPMLIQLFDDHYEKVTDEISKFPCVSHGFLESSGPGRLGLRLDCLWISLRSSFGLVTNHLFSIT